MRVIVKLLCAVLAFTILWLAAWYSMMAADVARVKASIAHHYQRLRELDPTISLKADAVYATGFPFRFEVAVERPTLSTVSTDETFSVSFPKVTLTKTDSGQGRYRVNLPNMVEALYAQNGKVPEHYTVTADVLPKVALSAMDSKTRCGPMMGARCADVSDDAPLISYALGLPKSITLHMTLGNESRDARFDLLPIDFNVPVFQPIPQKMSWPLELFVRVLREALVFKTPGNEVHP